MRNFILIFCCCVFWISQNQAQNFAPIGAKWYYSHEYSNDYFTYAGYIKLEAIKDTIIKETPARVIEIRTSKKNAVISHEYITQKGDSILYFNPYLDRFVLLYNFAAKVGDTIIVHENATKIPIGFLDQSLYDSATLFKYAITAVDSINIKNKWFRRQHISDVRQPRSTWSFIGWGSSNTTILFKYGAATYLFGHTRAANAATSFVPFLRCYEDNDTSYKNPGWDKACDYENGWQSTEEIPFNDYQVQLYPNPCKDMLHINVPAASPANISYSITNVLGSRQAGGVLTGSIDISKLAPGVYMLNVYQNGSVLGNRKFIKL